MIIECFAIVVFTAASKAFQLCPQESRQALQMRQCFANCLDLIEFSEAKRQPCFYNLTSGKSKGCGKPFTPNTKKKVVICDQGQVNDQGINNINPCDMIYFDVIHFSSTSDELSTEIYADKLLRHAPKLRKMGVKILGRIGSGETANNFMRISESATLRVKYAASIIDVMEQLQLDGLYLQWMYPGCPIGQAGGCKNANPHKKYTVDLLTEIGKSLKSTGRILITLIAQSPFVYFALGDYYSEVMPYVDYFILETNHLVTHENTKADFNFNLKITREWVKMLISKVRDPLFGRRLLLTFNINIMSYQLKNPKDERINVDHVRNSKKYSMHLQLNEWCKLVRPGSGYKVVPSNDTQNYAVKGDHLFVYDDVRSLTEKFEWFNSIGGGAHIWNTWADDLNNECSCGRLPCIRTVAELAKATDCDPTPCF